MILCLKCNAEVVAEATSCVICEAAINNTIFIGKNYKYYLQKWEIGDKDKNDQSWNGAAFLFGFVWMAYRKMYLKVLAGLGGVFILSLLNTNHNIIVPFFGISTIACWNGNYWYKFHVDERIKKITRKYANENIQAKLAQQGGTSVVAAIGFALVYLVTLTPITISFDGT